MSIEENYNHWRLDTDANSLLWLYFDKKNASVNTVDREVMEELSDLMNNIHNIPTDKTYKGVILASAKKTGFIAGADISQFNKFNTIEEAIALLRLGQTILDKIENLTIPSVALIDGFCLGGGLEIALACHYRIAEDGPKTRLGLPEIRLGIHPGWGGTVRLPRLIGAPQAFNLILQGHTINGRVAAKLGLVDAVVPRRQLIKAAQSYALNRPEKHHPTIFQQASNSKAARHLIAPFMRKQLRSKVKSEHYPAPYIVLDNWEAMGVQGDEAMQREATTCGKLFFSDTCENLVRVFFLQERLKGLAKDNLNVKEFTPKHVHVIGAGTMGGDIAAWCALQGMTVTLQDREPKFIAPAIKRAYKLYKGILKEEFLTQKAMDRLIPDVNGLGIKRADVIIEAIFEDLPTKQALFKSLEKQAKASAILATNTSSIPLDEINTVMDSPERLVGIHFFNPVSKMLLVEIVKGQKTDEAVVDRAIAFTRKIDKLPLPVKSSPGFLINRILMPYLLESVVLLDEGISAETIDKAMVDFGMPMGPIMLADAVGLDVCLSVAENLSRFYGNAIPKQLDAKVKEKKLGRKTHEGFYSYTNEGKPIKAAPSQEAPALSPIANRLIGCMLNEAFKCLKEGVISDADLLDAGMIFGTGFPPFLGGPIHYAKKEGINELSNQQIKQSQENENNRNAVKADDSSDSIA